MFTIIIFYGYKITFFDALRELIIVQGVKPNLIFPRFPIFVFVT